MYLDPASAGPLLLVEMASALGPVLDTVLSLRGLLILLIGTLFGFILGIIPGMSGLIALALLIPLTFGMDALTAFMLLTSAYGGSNLGGSITSILLNTPGASANAATILDGYPMTRQGRAGEAIGASSAASATGAIFGILILVVSIPLVMQVVILFGAPETFWLGIWGLTVISVIVKGNVISGLISAGFGVVFALHGRNQMTGTIRFDYGIGFLVDGVKLVPALIGLFAVAEMIRLIAKGGTIAKADIDTEIGKGKWKGVKKVYTTHKWIFIRSAIIGSIIGIIPGVGTSAANYLAYFHAVQTSSTPEKYGHGEIGGVIAPEASNDAKDGTGFLPTLALGIPGSAAMAVMLGAFILHGITPGPFLMEENMDLVLVIIVSLLISNVLSSVIGLSLSNHLVKITRLDVNILVPVVLVIAMFGSYALNNLIYDMFTTMFFGILGFIMLKVDMSRVPMILGMVLGPIVAINFFQSLQISRGDYQIFVDSTLSLLLVALVLFSLFLPWIRSSIRTLTLE